MWRLKQDLDFFRTEMAMCWCWTEECRAWLLGFDTVSRNISYHNCCIFDFNTIQLSILSNLSVVGLWTCSLATVLLRATWSLRWFDHTVSSQSLRQGAIKRARGADLPKRLVAQKRLCELQPPGCSPLRIPRFEWWRQRWSMERWRWQSRFWNMLDSSTTYQF